MNGQEAEIFRGICKRLGCFKIPEMEFSAEEEREILDLYKPDSLPDALQDLTVSLIKHIEALPDPVAGHKQSMIN